MSTRKDVRSRIGWANGRSRARASHDYPNNSDVTMQATIPIIVFRKKLTGILSTNGKFSKVSRVLANEAITNGAVACEKSYKYNHISKVVNLIKIPVATSRSSVKYIDCVVDKDVAPSTIVLGLPALHSLNYQMKVGNVRVVHRIIHRRKRGTRERSRSPLINRYRVNRGGEPNRDSRGRRQRESHSSLRHQYAANSQPHFRRSDSIELLSMEEMREIENW